MIKKLKRKTEQQKTSNYWSSEALNSWFLGQKGCGGFRSQTCLKYPRAFQYVSKNVNPLWMILPFFLKDLLSLIMLFFSILPDTFGSPGLPFNVPNPFCTWPILAKFYANVSSGLGQHPWTFFPASSKSKKTSETEFMTYRFYWLRLAVQKV